MSTTAQQRNAVPFPHQGASRGGTGQPSSGGTGQPESRCDLVPRASCCVAATAEAAPALRAFARDMARKWSLGADTEDALTVIVTELVTNAVLHSGSPEVSLLLGLDSGTLTIVVRDSGHWKPRPSPRQEPLDEGVLCGRGLTLVSAYATRTRTQPSARGTCVVADLSLTRAERRASGHQNRRARPQHRASAAFGG